MIAITTTELERRIHRFEVGEAKLAQLGQTLVDRRPGELEAIESNLTSTRRELADMKNLYAERLARGSDPAIEIAS